MVAMHTAKQCPIPFSPCCTSSYNLLLCMKLVGNNIVALPAEMSRPFPSSEPQTDSDEG